MPLNTVNQILFQKGLTAKLHVGGVFPMVVTADPDFIQHILQKNRRKYAKSTRNFEKIQRFWGRGLLTSEGPYWLKQRRLIQPGFHKNRLKEILKLMDRITDDFLHGLDSEVQKNPEVDIYEKMREATLRIIANAIFSSSLREEEFQKINKILPRLQNFIIRMIRQPYLHWWLKWSGQIKAHEDLRKEGNDIFESYIQKRRASGVAKDDLLQMLLDVRYEDTGEGMTDAQLMDEINILFIAGHDTSASALGWIWYLLSKHPDEMNKLSAEVNRVVPGDEITFEQIPQLTYTQQVIEEAIRLYPPAWATNRIAIEDDEFKGIPIKKGTTLATYIYGVHRSPQIWEDPESFNPDRFTKEKKKARHPFAYVPFGGGPRLCIGKQFGIMEMKLILAKMVKRYKLELVPNQNIEASPLVNLQPEDGIKMKVVKR